MKTTVATWVIGLSVIFADHAFAQVSLRERSYGEALIRDFDLRKRADAQTAERLHFLFHPETGAMIGTYTGTELEPSQPPKVPPPRISGVSVEHDGLAFQRLKFQTPAEAQAAFADIADGRVMYGSAPPVTAQLRGAQLVFVSGQAVRDPQAAKRMLAAAWEGLPAPAVAPEASFTELEDRDLALTTNLRDGPIRALVERVRSEKQAQAAKEPAASELYTPPTYTFGNGTARVQQPSGFRVDLRLDDQGASLVVARDDRREKTLRDHVAAMGVHPVGAANVIEGLFGR